MQHVSDFFFLLCIIHSSKVSHFSFIESNFDQIMRNSQENSGSCGPRFTPDSWEKTVGLLRKTQNLRGDTEQQCPNAPIGEPPIRHA